MLSPRPLPPPLFQLLDDDPPVLLLSLLAPLIRLLLLLPLDGDERRLDEKDGDDEEVPLPPEPAVTEEESRGRFAVPVARIFFSSLARAALFSLTRKPPPRDSGIR